MSQFRGDSIATSILVELRASVENFHSGTMNPYHNFILGYDEKPKKLVGVTFEEAITIAGIDQIICDENNFT